MFLKKFKKTFIILLTLFIIPFNVNAYSDYIIASGENIGISINSKGIVIVGTYGIDNEFPAAKAGLKVGDIITKINDKEINSISEMLTIINNLNENEITIDYLRANKNHKTILTLKKDNDILKTGLYVKDTITGVGTLTFIDPNTKLFGALGHEITEKTTGKIFDISGGNIFETSVINIERSENGNPGEKTAKFYMNNIDGNIKENTNKGIFGNYTSEINKNNLYKVANISDIKKGKAKIRTVLNGTEIKEYEINILKINDNINQKTKNILFEITDQELIEKTGGIIQGMSGSPIIQNEYIIGAVTHVVVENPTRGYGIFITNMLEEAEN